MSRSSLCWWVYINQRLNYDSAGLGQRRHTIVGVSCDLNQGSPVQCHNDYDNDNNDVIKIKVAPNSKPKPRASISVPPQTSRSEHSGSSGRARSASFLSRVIAKRGGPLEPLVEDNTRKVPQKQACTRNLGPNMNSLPRRFSQYHSENDEMIIDNTSTLSNPRRRSLTIVDPTMTHTWTAAKVASIINSNNQERSKEATINDLKKRAEARKNETLIKRVNSMPNGGASAAVNSAREKFLAKIGEDPTK